MKRKNKEQILTGGDEDIPLGCYRVMINENNKNNKPDKSKSK